MRIGLVGAGFMGRGIATCFLARGFSIRVFDQNFTDDIPRDIEQYLRELVDHDCAPAGVLDAWRAQFHPAQSLADFADCDFVIESVAEDVVVKQKLFKELERVIRPDVPLTTNTSAIPISLMQKSLAHPRRFAGMHWAGPAHVSQFIEVIRGEQTDDNTIETILRIAKELGKSTALVNRDIEGFIVNRLCYAMYREALHLFSQGVGDVETIDRCWRDVAGAWSHFAGPFRWMDLTGTSLYAAGMRRIFPTLCNDADIPDIMRKLEESGAMGTANGSGFYTYSKEDSQRWNQLLRDASWKERKAKEQS